ncbi:UNVERIFIED_CONTAM: hypothetical protein FKN15_008292 [Acipenser sinensis]
MDNLFDLSSAESEDIQPEQPSPTDNLTPRLVQYNLSPAIPSPNLALSHPKQRGFRKRPAPAPKQLMYKDCPVARILKALFDSGIQIPPNSGREALFLMLCKSIEAEPIYPPPSKHRRATTRGQQASYASAAAPALGPAMEANTASTQLQINLSDSYSNLRTQIPPPANSTYLISK